MPTKKKKKKKGKTRWGGREERGTEWRRVRPGRRRERPPPRLPTRFSPWIRCAGDRGRPPAPSLPFAPTWSTVFFLNLIRYGCPVPFCISGCPSCLAAARRRVAPSMMRLARGPAGAMLGCLVLLLLVKIAAASHREKAAARALQRSPASHPPPHPHTHTQKKWTVRGRCPCLAPFTGISSVPALYIF